MRKLTMVIVGAIVLLLVGTLAWNANAAPLTGATALPATNYSIIEKAACGLRQGLFAKRQGLFARCPIGQHWRAGGCVPCAFAFVCPLPAGCCTGTRGGTYYNCSGVRPGCTIGFCRG